MQTAEPARQPRMPVAPPADDAARWTALEVLDAQANGSFVYSVRSTGVYCRPSCPARPARPENVAFHATGAEAEAAGLRPCKRCRPNAPALAERQAEALLEGRIAEDLRQEAGSVTEAEFAVAYKSSNPFYAKGSERLGMTPTAYRKDGAGTRIRVAAAKCSLGSILVAATDKGICTILLGDDPDTLARDLQDRFPKAELSGGDEAFERWVVEVIGFVEAPGRGLDLPLDIGGTAFQQRVWAALRAIPVGSTATYADIARTIGEPAAVRAVAQACGANRLAVAIPCHRVVRSDGSLSGYRWGVERKRSLLAREGVAR
jgi:AraC family transcriptional regulator of adaptative response/methylated-DNA-[protein]-cysteine methyltransferase